MNAWHEEQSRIRDITRQTADGIARELGDGWTVDTDPRWDGYRVVYVDGPDGARIAVGLDWRNPDRVTVSGCYPDGARDVYPSAEPHEIGMGRDRGPVVHAREIRRRLLPGYLPELARVREGIERHTNGAGAMRRAAESLAALVPGGSLPEHRQDSHRARVWLPSGELEVMHGGESCRLELRSVPVNVARAMLAAYAAALVSGSDTAGGAS